MILIVMLIVLIVMGFVVLKIMGDNTQNINQDITDKTNEGERLAPQNNNFLTMLSDSFSKIMGQLGFMGFVKKNDLKTAQDFVSFEIIDCGHQGMIRFTDLNGKKYYRMIMECGNVNYLLKTADDQDTLDEGFKRAINAWNFPWAIYMQTRISDNRAVVMETKELIESTITKYPALANYGKQYYEYLKTDVLPFGKKTVFDNAGEKKQKSMLVKKTYIIVAYNEVSQLVEDMDESDMDEWVRRELTDRCNVVYSQLKGLDVTSHVLSTPELSALVYQAFNKKTGGSSDGIVTNDFLSGTVTSEIKDIDPADLNFLINEFLNKLDTEIISAGNASFDSRARAKELTRRAEKLKDVLYENPRNFEDNNGGIY